MQETLKTAPVSQSIVFELTHDGYPPTRTTHPLSQAAHHASDKPVSGDLMLDAVGCVSQESVSNERPADNGGGGGFWEFADNVSSDTSVRIGVIHEAAGYVANPAEVEGIAIEAEVTRDKLVVFSQLEAVEAEPVFVETLGSINSTSNPTVVSCTAGTWVRDLTQEGVEPNPGPPKGPKKVRFSSVFP